ncbi:RNA polymerase sigma factor SigM [Pseudonocardia sp. H11422]|uniref:RNA polymerase sigma factor SigM n=1 Tax=Pseudonocardia sp. H11422 TaxID=2835866 RepID=UPI001BDD9663|nr:RNA polymerase sigma factor SigM [Pseudonocardia sp. H11422]
MSVTTRSDLELVDAHRGGDRMAFDELVRRHGDRLWAVALRTLRHREDAADAVQEALVSAYRRIDGYRGEASVSAWLHRIVVNVCIDRIRRERVRPTVPWPERDVPARGPDPVQDLTTRLAVGDALALLPIEQRVAVVLVDVQGYPVAEVAAILQVPPGTVKSRCARGRARLAVLLGHLRGVGT